MSAEMIIVKEQLAVAVQAMKPAVFLPDEKSGRPPKF